MAVTRAPGMWTIEDLYSLPDEKRYELIDGELHEMPPPNRKHQRTLARIAEVVLPELRRLGGSWYPAPTGVFLAGKTMLGPDLLVLLPERRGQESERGIEGAPDLVVEILSPSNAGRDRVEKRRLYASAGVPEYWIVDPDEETIEVLVLDGDAYRTHRLARGDEAVNSVVLPELGFPAAKVFAE